MDDTLNDDILRTSELLAKRGPRGMLDLMSQISAQFAASVAEAGREDVAAQWKASSAAMERLATTLGAAVASPAVAAEPTEEQDADGDNEFEDDPDEEDGDEEDGDEDGDASEDDEPEPSPEEEEPSPSQPTAATSQSATTASGDPVAANEPKEKEGAVALPTTTATKERMKMKTVAGQFSVSPKVTTCRLRTVLESGERGELVGRANERGIEESEWRVETMTPERMRAWFGPGRYLFEWYGEDGKGGRTALGRSRAFRIFPDPATATLPALSVAAPAAAAAPPASGNALEQAFQISRYVDEKVHQERELEARRQEREHEMKKLEMELAAKERLARLQLQAKVETAKRAAPAEEAEASAGYAIDEGALLARIEETVAARVSAALKAKGGDGEDFELPGWLKAIGIDKSMLALAKPQIAQMIPGLLAKLQPNGVGGPSLPSAVATPESPPTAVATPYPNVTRFVRKDGAG